MSIPADPAALARLRRPHIDPDVTASIRAAARSSQVDFGYLMAQAAQESGFRPDARAEGSSAAGLYQFTESTWLDLVRRHGAQHGIAALAQKVEGGSSAQPVVGDESARQEILALRNDPRLAAAMAGEYARENKLELERALGRPARSTDLYLAHFLGPGGATSFLKAIAQDGTAPAAALLPSAAAANPSVFYDGRSGEARSVAEIYRRFDQKIAADAAQFGEAGPTPPTVPSLPVSRAGFARLAEPVRAMLNLMTLTALKVLGGDAIDRTAAQSSLLDIGGSGRRNDFSA